MLNATNVLVNAMPFEKMDILWYREHVLEGRRDGMASSCLTELNLRNCHLSCLPDGIGNLISLRTLNLTRNNSSTLPDSICNLTCLKRLRLEENNVSHLPSGIGRLTSLEILNLRRNSLCTLPDTIVKLSCLKELDVGNNKLSHLPSEIGNLHSLLILELQGNNGFRALPESICKLVRLQQLSLYGCDLSNLPSEIDRLISLGSLYLGHNRSLTLPESIWRLTRLMTLGLGGCKLSHLPSGTGGLVSLVTSDILENNNICTIPDSNSNLPCFDTIWLDNCAKLRSLPRLPTSLGLSVHLDIGISELQRAVGIVVLAGDEEVRKWFAYHDGRGSNISFVMPPSPSVKQKILGWILRLLVQAPREAPHQFYQLEIKERLVMLLRKWDLVYFKLCFVAKRRLAVGGWRRGVAVTGWGGAVPAEGDGQGYGGLQFEGGDEVEIPIYALRNVLVENWNRTEQLLVSPNTLVKKWAIDLIYEADDEIHKGDNILEDIVVWLLNSTGKFSAKSAWAVLRSCAPEVG
ncbi:hypothetical protein RHSIM_Rhsim01G0105000 [Rhododendron simsii]|uniref:Disease resistance R13L4/SHOC-2-like LRR domain-containing protein n=1 Tax=Rhododendron simsii TaxID=118357 RepID=A0A834HIK5_RHOSS|nr:hypothetical protein RHSIM_Rhsim01G0105000 [Rhododendron simsii]